MISRTPLVTILGEIRPLNLGLFFDPSGIADGAPKYRQPGKTLRCSTATLGRQKTDDDRLSGRRCAIRSNSGLKVRKFEIAVQCSLLGTGQTSISSKTLNCRKMLICCHYDHLDPVDPGCHPRLR